MTLTFDRWKRDYFSSVNAAETCAYWLTGEPQYLDDPVYGLIHPVHWLRRLWWAWRLEQSPCSHKLGS